jgi:hypothetical protein
MTACAQHLTTRNFESTTKQTNKSSSMHTMVVVVVIIRDAPKMHWPIISPKQLANGRFLDKLTFEYTVLFNNKCY